MVIISDMDKLQMDIPSAVCIGKFDGVHIGHKLIVEKVVSQKVRGLRAVVFTFDPSPEELFTGKRPVEICSRDEKIEILDRMGVDVIVEYPLTFESAAVEGEDFVRDILVNKLNMTYIAAGDDLSFGKGGKGDRALIERLAPEYGYDVDIIEKVRVDGEQVSSSRIRQAMADARFDEASRMLGRI